MSMGTVLDPTALRRDCNESAGPDAGPLNGKHIGFRIDRMWRAWTWISEQWAKKLREAGAEVSFWQSAGRSGEEGERCASEYADYVASIDIAIVGLANCGSCTGWTVRDAITAAEAGLPTVAIATEHFRTFAHDIAARGGRPGLRVHVLPYPLNEQIKEDVLPVGEAHFLPMLETLGATLPVRENAA